MSEKMPEIHTLYRDSLYVEEEEACASLGLKWSPDFWCLSAAEIDGVCYLPLEVFVKTLAFLQDAICPGNRCYNDTSWEIGPAWNAGPHPALCAECENEMIAAAEQDRQAELVQAAQRAGRFDCV